MAPHVIILLALLATALCKSIDTSCDQIRAFVDGHNIRRQDLAQGKVAGQPPAKYMKFMIWDDELAAKATKWASLNLFMHNPDKTIGSGRFRVGENIFAYSTTDLSYKLDPDTALESWFNEHEDFSYGPLSDSDFDGSSGNDIGHYTQMAWADTTHVGCGMTERVENGWKKFLVVCNYGPQGNMIGEAPYKTKRGGSLVCDDSYDCDRPYGDLC